VGVSNGRGLFDPVAPFRTAGHGGKYVGNLWRDGSVPAPCSAVWSSRSPTSEALGFAVPEGDAAKSSSAHGAAACSAFCNRPGG
jgi:hypothetical protein